MSYLLFFCPLILGMWRLPFPSKELLYYLLIGCCKPAKALFSYHTHQFSWIICRCILQYYFYYLLPSFIAFPSYIDLDTNVLFFGMYSLKRLSCSLSIVFQTVSLYFQVWISIYTIMYYMDNIVHPSYYWISLFLWC